MPQRCGGSRKDKKVGVVLSRPQTVKPEEVIIDRQDLHLAEPGFPGIFRSVSGRITVPVPADGCSTMPAGRQCRMLKPYSSWSSRSPQG